ncbi:MAG: hypothetical protein HY000_35820 [Planctomycetes bacterium]|nr:hypothetical protein [Planctomycetota bacterium]
MLREFVELPAFTRLIQEGMLTDEELGELQQDIIRKRGRIDRVPGVSGLLKMRWRNPRRERGTRGGYRVFFVDFEDLGITVLVYLMDKDEQDDLTPAERHRFAQIIRGLRKELG